MFGFGVVRGSGCTAFEVVEDLGLCWGISCSGFVLCDTGRSQDHVLEPDLQENVFERLLPLLEGRRGRERRGANVHVWMTVS